MHLNPPGSLGYYTFYGGGSFVRDQLFYVLPIVCEGSVLVFVLVYVALCPFKFCNHLEERELVALLLLSYCKRPVALPHVAVGWSAVCDCGIF